MCYFCLWHFSPEKNGEEKGKGKNPNAMKSQKLSMFGIFLSIIILFRGRYNQIKRHRHKYSTFLEHEFVVLDFCHKTYVICKLLRNAQEYWKKERIARHRLFYKNHSSKNYQPHFPGIVFGKSAKILSPDSNSTGND